MPEISPQSPQETSRPSKGRASLIPAVILAAVGMAPFGLTAPLGGVVSFYDLNGIGALIVVFWLLFLVTVVYAWLTKSDERASIAIFAVWAITLLNLGGCGFQWVALDKALG